MEVDSSSNIYLLGIHRSNSDQGCIELDISIPKQKCYGDLIYTAPGVNFNGWSKKLNTQDPQSIINVFCTLSNKILSLYLDSLNLNHWYKIKLVWVSAIIFFNFGTHLSGTQSLFYS